MNPTAQPAAEKAQHLPWRVVPDPIHGASIYDAKGNQIVAHIYDEENAVIIVRSVNQSAAVDATYRALIAFVPLCAKCANRAAWIGSMSGVRLCDEHKRDSSYINEAVYNAIAALVQVEQALKGEA